jgi:hypothetical protein
MSLRVGETTVEFLQIIQQMSIVLNDAAIGDLQPLLFQFEFVDAGGHLAALLLRAGDVGLMADQQVLERESQRHDSRRNSTIK